MGKKLILLVFLFGIGRCSVAQITLTPNPSAEIIKTILSGTNVTISNVEINCGDSAYGYITADWNTIFSGLGVAMTNGSIENIPGPNSSGSEGTDLSLPGDEDLDVITGVTTYDACVIEFDCMSLSDTLLFYYVFGSEEYPEFVDGVVNDGFGVFINGLGINGSFSNNAANFALIPGTTIPVCINEINYGTNDCSLGGPSGPCSYCEYYINNCNGITYQYDGFTKLMKGIVPITPGEIYHIKIALADGGDGVWDTGILFPNGAFRTNEWVGIEDHEIDNTINIYPNPASSSIVINGQFTMNNGQLKIMNTQGQLVYQCAMGDEQLTIDVSALSKGIYFISLSDREKTVNRKFVKE